MTETQLTLEGPAGAIEAILHETEPTAAVSIVAHPHPLYGGTMKNAVVERCCRLLARLGHTVMRFNFRGVGRSEGVHDDGVGEVLDLIAACNSLREITDREIDLALGYSFGAATLLRALERGGAELPHRALLIAPPLAFGNYDFVGDLSPTRPLALLCGSEDDLTPADKLEPTRHWPGLLGVELIDGVGHDLGATTKPEAFDQALETLIDRLMSAS